MKLYRLFLANRLQVSVSAIVVLVLIQVTGCSDSCSQDHPPPWQINTSDNPYHLDYLTTNFDLKSVRWENDTTGQSGNAFLSVVNQCVFPVGCGTWLKVEMDIPLVAGLNMVRTFEKDKGDDCEFEDEYQINLE